MLSDAEGAASSPFARYRQIGSDVLAPTPLAAATCNARLPYTAGAPFGFDWWTTQLFLKARLPPRRARSGVRLV